MSDVWRGNRPTREPADAPERTPLWEQASVYMEEVRSALIPLRGVLEQYERKVAALEQERNEYKWLAQQMEDLKDGLADEVERLRAADNTPTPEKLEAWGEWFDDPQNPFIGFDTTKLAHHTSTAGYVCRVFAAQLRALTKPEGDR